MFSPDALIAMYVPDVREALDFYTDKLGFKVITDSADEEFSFATAALPGAGSGRRRDHRVPDPAGERPDPGPHQGPLRQRDHPDGDGVVVLARFSEAYRTSGGLG